MWGGVGLLATSSLAPHPTLSQRRGQQSAGTLVTHGLQARAGVGGGESDAEGGAAAGGAFDADVAGGFLNDAVRDGQAQAGAAPDAFGGVERVVDLGNVFRRDADAGVGYFNHQRIVF